MGLRTVVEIIDDRYTGGRLQHRVKEFASRHNLNAGIEENWGVFKRK
ncbi:MAG: hypothetical protein GWO20_02995 [Candidatus Korarchaeota archaeon]|nr:hypothetical protein [Candidatus Korarchaeota archaeon]NIU82450.1 hypothetical protein [Candidatus Thorarchaeota archaeon]NIW15679.1 hypothetical protein [Candidatus Thorarchaeota archaeon]NIW51090.1 hypothetical protein [Candidatus Korarchaeota archaeon]